MFNVKSYVKGAALSAGQRMVNTVIAGATRGLPMNILSSATSTAESLFNAGSSFQSISSITSLKTDSLVNRGSDIYYAIAGKDPARVASAALRELRSVGAGDSDHHVYHVNPSSAIRAKRLRDADVILSAVS